MHKYKVDSKGRISLGRLAEGISSFEIKRAGNDLLLIPYVELPAHEAWLYKNKKILKSVSKGIDESKKRNVKKIK